jgi:hypothetical protein
MSLVCATHRRALRTPSARPRCGPADRCGRCGATGQEPHQRGRWRCRFCGYGKSWREPEDSATAIDRYDVLTRHGVTSGDRDFRLVGGFTLVGGGGFDLAPGSICSVVALPAAVRVVVAMGDPGADVQIPYGELTALSVSGGATTTESGFVGGGFGFWGAFEGILALDPQLRVSQDPDQHWHAHRRNLR